MDGKKGTVNYLGASLACVTPGSTVSAASTYYRHTIATYYTYSLSPRSSTNFLSNVNINMLAQSTYLLTTTACTQLYFHNQLLLVPKPVV